MLTARLAGLTKTGNPLGKLEDVMEASGFAQFTLAGFLGTSVASTLVAAVLLRWRKKAESEIKAHFDKQFKVFLSVRDWKQQSLSELLGPLVMQFERTKAAFKRWNGKNLYLEAQIVRQGNQTIRDTLLSKGHLVPPHLISHATALIVHYDVWMEAFDHHRGPNAPTGDTTFVFAGPAGYPFPGDAEAAFKTEFARLQRELYGV